MTPLLRFRHGWRPPGFSLGDVAVFDKAGTLVRVIPVGELRRRPANGPHRAYPAPREMFAYAKRKK